MEVGLGLKLGLKDPLACASHNQQVALFTISILQVYCSWLYRPCNIGLSLRIVHKVCKHLILANTEVCLVLVDYVAHLPLAD